MIKTENITYLSASTNGSYIDALGNRIYGITKGQIVSVLSSDEATKKFIPDNYSGLNFHFYENINILDNNAYCVGNKDIDVYGLNTITGSVYNTAFISGLYSFSSSIKNPLYLNGLLLKRNGPYHHSMFKQINNSYNPIVKYIKENSIISILQPPKQNFVAKDGIVSMFVGGRGNLVANYQEPYVSVKYKPLIHNLVVQESDETIEFVKFTHTYGNNLNTFSDPLVVNQLGCKNCEKQVYDKLYEMYSGEIDSSPIKDIDSIIYSEVIYPKEINTFLKKTRGRTRFYCNWDNNRGDRNRQNFINSQGVVINECSYWPLDARKNETGSVVRVGIQAEDEGELQNSYSVFFSDDELGNINTPISEPWGKNDRVAIGFNCNVGPANPYDTSRPPLPSDNKYSIIIPGLVNSGSATSLSNLFIPYSSSYAISFWMKAIDMVYGTTRYDKSIIFHAGTIASGTMIYLVSGSSNNYKLAFSSSYHSSLGSEWVTKNNCIVADSAYNGPSGFYNVIVNHNINTSSAADRVNIFVNGIKQELYCPSDSQITSEVINLGQDIAFLCSSSYAGYPFGGAISDFGLFNSTLSQSHINELFNSGSRKQYELLSFSDKLNLYYKIGDGIGMMPKDTLRAYLEDFGTVDADPTLSPLAYYNDGDRTINKIGDYRDLTAILGLGGYSRFYNGKNTVFESIQNRHAIISGSRSLNISNYDTLTEIFDVDGTNLKRNFEDYNYSSSFYKNTRNDDWNINYRNGILYGRKFAKISNNTLSWNSSSLLLNSSYRTPPYSKTLRSTSSIFSYSDNAEWTCDRETGIDRKYETYEKYADSIRNIGKSFSICPEFRISEVMDYYLLNNDKGFLSPISGIFSITGAEIFDSSDSEFYKTYSHSDFLKYFDIIREENQQYVETSKIKLKCKAIKKLLPYEGFFPSERTVQLASLFSKSYGNYVSPYVNVDDPRATYFRSFLSPMFAPGILYNSIKSGLAVGYPIYNGTNSPSTCEDIEGGSPLEHLDPYIAYSTPSVSEVSGNNFRTRRDIYTCFLEKEKHAWCHNIKDALDTSYGSFLTSSVEQIESDSRLKWKTVLNNNFSKKIPFDGLLDPERYLSNIPIWDSEPFLSSSLREDLRDKNTNQASYWSGEGDNRYKLAMHNFLAEVPNFFLKDSTFTNFSSNAISKEGINIKKEQADKYYGMDVVISNSKCKSLTDWVSLLASNALENYITSSNLSKRKIREIVGIHTSIYSEEKAFGPPWIYDSKYFKSNDRMSYHHSYEPYTPCYFDGFAIARITFFPYKGAGFYSLDEIQSNCTASYIRMPSHRSGSWALNRMGEMLELQTIASLDENSLEESGFFYSGSFSDPEFEDGNTMKGVFPITSKTRDIISASHNWQNMDSSVELFGKKKNKKVVYTKSDSTQQFGGEQIEDSIDADSVWTIQTKWETPVLNFEYTGNLDDDFDNNVYGMWHQAGRELSSEEGIWFEIKDLPSKKIENTCDVLNKKRGFYGKTSGVLYNIAPINDLRAFYNRTENVIKKKNKNGELILYIANGAALESGPTNPSYIKFSNLSKDVLNGYSYQSQLFESCSYNITMDRFGGDSVLDINIAKSWKAFSSNLLTAQEICDAINNATCWDSTKFRYTYNNLYSWWSIGLSFYDPIVAPKYFITASTFIPIANDVPFTVLTSSDNPVAAIRMKIVNKCGRLIYDWSGSNSAVSYNMNNSGTYYDEDWDCRRARDFNFPRYLESGKNGENVNVELYFEDQDRDPYAAMFYGKDNKTGQNIVSPSAAFTGGEDGKEYQVESLADLLGFEKTRKRIGNVSEEKIISEAIVAIPFIENGEKRKFIEIPRYCIDVSLGKIKQDNNKPLVAESIKTMVEKMKKYVFPPRMDFITNENITPYTMYIFEFSTKLSAGDLKKIWQNISPDISRNHQVEESIIEHEIQDSELLNDANMKENLRWMVFKVKQKAEINYFAKTLSDSDDDRFKFDFKFGKNDTGIKLVPQYSYNWPYDFCSLVELCNIDAEVHMGKEDKK